MATINKDFRLKNGLVVEGTTATVNGANVLTEGSTEFLQDTVGAMVDGGTQSNITVTYNDSTGKLNFSAENGVADSTTSDLAEGTNLYFTDERAQDAVAQALANGTHTNITVGYNDSTNAISLTGAVTYTDENARDAVASLITNSTHTGVSVVYTDNTTSEGTLAFTNTGVRQLTGTANEVEVSASAGEVTVGLPNDITIAGNVTINGTPSQATHAVTKGYVDNVTAGLNFHAAAHVATTSNLTSTYNNGTSGVGATLTGTGAFPLIDGETVVELERVLVKSQSDAIQNGVYVLTNDGDPSGSWVLTRATDADNSPAGELATGDFLFVETGTLNGGYGYIISTTGVITIGTTQVNYVVFNAGQTVVAGNGLTESSPGTLAIDTSVTVDKNTAQTLTNKTINATNNTITVTSTNVSDFTDAAQDAVATSLTTNATHSGVSVSYVDSSDAINITNTGVTGITGTSNQIAASSSTGSVTLSLPQDIATTSTPTFAGTKYANSEESSATATVGLTETAVDIWSSTTYTSAKYLIQLKKNNDVETVEVLVMVDGNNNVYLTVYANMISNASLGSINADFLSGNVRLLVTATNATTSVKVHKTYIKA